MLLASSDDALRVRLGRRLEAAGHSLQEASDGVEVLERLDRGGVDVAIVDLSMPRLSGAQIVERLRAQHSASALPVLVLAGGEKSAEVVRAIKLGANDYAHRGLDFELLHARVQGLIRLSVAARAAQTALAEVQSALESSAQLKLELSPEGRLRDASPGSKTLLGYAPEQLLGRLFFDLVHNQDSLALRQGAPAGQPLPLKEPLVLRLRRQDGRWIWVELRTRRVLGPDGRLQTLHAYATDVTARVEPEAVQPPAGLNLRVEDQRERARLANMLARIGYALVEDSPGQLRIVRTKKPDGSA